MCLLKFSKEMFRNFPVILEKKYSRVKIPNFNHYLSISRLGIGRILEVIEKSW